MKVVIFPKMRNYLGKVGVNITLARLRRKFTSEQVAERAGISLECLVEVENGSPDVSLGVYTVVLRVLGLDKDIYRIAEDDVLGRKLQDIELLKK